MLKSIKIFLSLLQTSIRGSISFRGAFLMQIALLVSNNLIFFFIWWVFFRKFDDISGWTITDMVALMGIGSGAYGLMQVCFGGVKYLSRMIVSGDLDPYMTQPRSLLIHLISSKSYTKGWGNLMTMVVLVLLGRLYVIPAIFLVVFSVVCGCLVFTSIGIMAHSLAFWLGPTETVSRKYCESLYLFTLYPTNIYSGLLQLMMFTLLPAGIIGYIPVEILREFSWVKMAVLLSSSVGFFLLASWIFYLGTKRYESGNQFGARA